MFEPVLKAIIFTSSDIAGSAAYSVVIVIASKTQTKIFTLPFCTEWNVNFAVFNI